MWRWLGILVWMPLLANFQVQMCDVPRRVLDFEGALLYWTAINGSVPYATIWPSANTAIGQGQTETLQPGYNLGFSATARTYLPKGHNFFETRFTSIVVRGGAQTRTVGFMLVGPTTLTNGGGARASSRQHYVSGDALYSICIYQGSCVRASVFGGPNYTKITDELTVSNNTVNNARLNVFTRSKFEGGGPRLGMSAQMYLPYGVRFASHLALRTPVGRRSLGVLSEVGATSTATRGLDVVLASGFDAKLSAALQIVHCCILYRAELGYELSTFFQMMNRRDLRLQGFGQQHGGRTIGFAGPYASLSVAF